MWPQQRCFSRYCPSLLCVVFFLGFLIYANHQLNVDVYSVLVNNNTAIDNSLKDIPICSSSDRARQRSLLYTLQSWTYFARQNRIQYWIAYGTLLGYVRNHSLLPHDTNLDIFIMEQHMPQLVLLSQTNFSFHYKLLIHPQWSIVDLKERQYFHSNGIDFRAANARFVHMKDDSFINIWPIYSYNPQETKTRINNQGLLTSYDQKYQWMSTSIDLIFPLRTCEINTIQVSCPAEPKQIVMDIYGPTSVDTPLIICVNGSWTRADKPVPTLTSTQMSTLSDSDLIEKALETIPTCESGDRKHQRILLSLLQAWSQLAEKYHIEYWLLYGSLVGYVQRQGLLPHDGDIDVVVDDEQIPKLINISQTNFSTDYEIKIQPQWKIVGFENRVYFRDQGIHFIQPNARFIHKDSWKHVDIFPLYYFHPVYGNQSDNITIYDNQDRWLSIPRKWVYPIETCYFSGIQTRCPTEPKTIVSTLYGASAVHQSNRKCENGSWVRT